LFCLRVEMVLDFLWYLKTSEKPIRLSRLAGDEWLFSFEHAAVRCSM
jgi:hypothetical protein